MNVNPLINFLSLVIFHKEMLDNLCNLLRYYADLINSVHDNRSSASLTLFHNIFNVISCPCCLSGVSSTTANHLHVSCSFPVFENPYPMDIHESPVTCTAYFAECPPDIIPILYSIGAKHKKTGYSQKVGQGKYAGDTPSFRDVFLFCLFGNRPCS